MKRASTLNTWWYLVAGGVTTAAAVAPVEWVRNSMLIIAGVQFLPLLWLAHRRGTVSTRLASLLGAVVALDSVAHVATGGQPGYTKPLVVVAGLVSTCCVIVGLVVLLRRRGYSHGAALVGDGATGSPRRRGGAEKKRAVRSKTAKRSTPARRKTAASKRAARRGARAAKR